MQPEIANDKTIATIRIDFFISVSLFFRGQCCLLYYIILYYIKRIKICRAVSVIYLRNKTIYVL